MSSNLDSIPRIDERRRLAAHQARLADIYEREKRAVVALHAEFNVERDALDVTGLAQALGDAEVYHDETFMACAVSSLPIFSDDEIVTDETTGDVYLRAALGLPPRYGDDATPQDAADTGVREQRP